MRKNNELIRLYDEVKKEVKEKQELLEIVCYKEKLEEKIGDNKDVYLRYKILSQGNSSLDTLVLAVALITLVINTLMAAVGLVNAWSISPKLCCWYLYRAFIRICNMADVLYYFKNKLLKLPTSNLGIRP